MLVNLAETLEYKVGRQLICDGSIFVFILYDLINIFKQEYNCICGWYLSQELTVIFISVSQVFNILFYIFLTLFIVYFNDNFPSLPG